MWDGKSSGRRSSTGLIDHVQGQGFGVGIAQGHIGACFWVGYLQVMALGRDIATLIALLHSGRCSEESYVSLTSTPEGFVEGHVHKTRATLTDGIRGAGEDRCAGVHAADRIEVLLDLFPAIGSTRKYRAIRRQTFRGVASEVD